MGMFTAPDFASVDHGLGRPLPESAHSPARQRILFVDLSYRQALLRVERARYNARRHQVKAGAP